MTVPTADVRSAATDAEEQARSVLQQCATLLEEAGAPGESVEDLRKLARQVGDVCVVAVVGAVNTGKSNLINALLHGDYAIVGTTETTATINHFSYGDPDPARPLRCCWRGGQVTTEPLAFLAGLQGSGDDALRLAEGIDHLEYLLPNAMLKRVKLVDTPGTGSVVMQHERMTADYLRLRERHDLETNRIRETADAIIYLVGPVAGMDDRYLLEQFTSSTAGVAHASKALGVIAKIDLSDKILDRRTELCAKIAAQLKASLHTVVPISAGMARLLDNTPGGSKDALADACELVARIPESQLETLLADEELFCSDLIGDCPVAPAERQALRHSLPSQWRVFTAVIMAARTADVPLRQRLRELAGIDSLQTTLNAHFLERGHILRCFRIARDARAILNHLRFYDLREARRRGLSERAQLARFLQFADTWGNGSDVAVELRDYLERQLGKRPEYPALEAAWKRADITLSELSIELGEHNADFEALQKLETGSQELSADEQAELKPLLGMYGTSSDIRLRGQLDVNVCTERQLAWRAAEAAARRGSVRQAVAGRAVARLGSLLAELDQKGRASQHP
jgi:hypothetical protein